ncbi:MAG: FAD-dependent oxidoreductase [Actinomycetes bacterium]
MSQRVIVVGAGVVGLSCAVRLAEAGYDTHVLARDLPGETTSALAGGIWQPYLCEPVDDVVRWARATHAELVRVNDEHPEAGVLIRDGVMLLRGLPTEADKPDWARRAADFVPLTPVRDPAPGYPGGFAARVPVVDTPVYLRWLAQRLEAAAGTLTRMPVPALPNRGIVVNATGIAARALASDPSVYPIRGQVVVLDNPGLTQWLDDDPGMMYVIPRTDDVIVGGTAEEGSWDTTPDPAEGERLLDKAAAVVPRLREARVRRHVVGLRPARPSVRLDTELLPDGAVVHCYGHGGSGITVGWGCAGDVLDQVRVLAG